MPMSELKTLMCPACKRVLPSTDFNYLPVDDRCSSCVPRDQAMALWDLKSKQAGQTMARILDSTDSYKTLKPLERMVSLAYDAWGGEAAFMEDAVTWIKELSEHPKTKGQAVNALMKLLALHAKVDRMKFEDDWKHMDDQQLRDTLKMRMMALFAEASIEQAKEQGKNELLGNA
jgi:hypothetical protein